MASTSSTPTDPSSSSPMIDDSAAKAANRRYEGLVTIRSKAVKGKGAWYWAHLEPVLIKNPDTNLPKAVKLKCSLCETIFSASNPSRTASEHLKRGACPNFSASPSPNSVVSPLPISCLPCPSSQSQNHHRKRAGCHLGTAPPPPPSNSLALVLDPTPLSSIAFNSSLALSGGKEDLGALAMLENSVKKLKSPKSSPGPSLRKDQADSALQLLSDWFYDVCGSVSFSSLEHPKFRAFLNQVGLPCLSRRVLSGHRLDSRFVEAKAEFEARLRDSMFFQVACNGWKRRNCCSGEESLVKFSVNLPNGTSLYHKSVLTGGLVSSKYAEEIMWEAVTEICGRSDLQRCVGIVGDRYKAKALRNLENQYHWMVNLSCQVQSLVSLIQDFVKELQVFRNVTESCVKLANFINNTAQVRSSFQKYRIQELGYAGLLKVPSCNCGCRRKDFMAVYMMLEDILTSARVLQMVILDESCKVICFEDPAGREVTSMVQNEGFWKELEAVYSLVNLIKGMAQEAEAERPLVGQCLPLWEDLKAKLKGWCARFNIVEGHVEKIVEKRFRKSYHPAWSAAFVLDPFYLIRDPSGKYLPPFRCLTDEQEKDVDKLITRLVSREEAHVALMELMKWRSEGLDPLYAQAVQVKQRDPLTGKMKAANPQSSRLVWETCLSEYKTLGKVVVRLIFLHATSCGFKCSCSFQKWVCLHRHSRVGLEKAQKMIFVAAHAKLNRQDISCEEEKDGELFCMAGCDNDMLDEIFPDAPSMVGIVLTWMDDETTGVATPVFLDELENGSLFLKMHSLLI